MNNVARILPGASLFVLALAIFSPVLHNGEYVFDDHVLIERNQDLQSPDIWQRALMQDYYASSEDLGVSGYYRPVAVWANAWDVRVLGHGPKASHWTNLVLHGIASLLVFLALPGLGATRLVAFVVALLFALHPAHAESVAFISGRVDVLVTIFVALAMWAAAWRAAWAPVVVGLASLAAYLSKETSIVLPLLLGLVWHASRSGPNFWHRIPWSQAIAWGLAAGLALWLRLQALGQWFPSSAAATRADGAWLLPFQGFAFDIAALFAPLRRIAMEPAPDHLGGTALAAGCLLACGVWWLAFRFGGETRFLRLALVAGLVSLAPTLNLLPQETQLSERFLYLPSVFLLAPCGVLAARALRRPATLRWAGVAVLLGVSIYLAYVSVWRARIWRTDVTIWRQAVAEEADRADFWSRLGLSLTERQRFDQAEAALRRAVALDGHNFNARLNLGVLLHTQRRFADAELEYQKAVQLQPHSINALMNLGNVQQNLRKAHEAYAAFSRAAQLKPDHFGAQRNAGLTALGLSQVDRAEAHLQIAERLRPGDKNVVQALEKIRLLRRRGRP